MRWGLQNYWVNMRAKHSWIAAVLAITFAFAPRSFAAPPRVVSTFLCTDEYVFRMVPPDNIAALSFLAADTHPVVSTIRDRVKGMTLIRPDTETVLNLKPDLVVMYEGTNPRLHAHLKEIGTPILDVPWANSIADIRRITTMLGDKLGAKDRAAAMLKRMDADLARAKSIAAHPPVRTLIYEPNGYATVGGATEEILQAAGLDNMAPTFKVGRTGAISVEAVVAAQPDLLLLNGEAARSRADLVLRHPALRALSDHTLIKWISLTPLLCPGPWSAQAAKPLAELGRKARQTSQALDEKFL
jgi:iron complex transport system substrate-binding protein